MSNILCMQAEVFDQLRRSYVPGVNYINMSRGGHTVSLDRLTRSPGLSFQPRESVETNEEYLQIIPYITLLFARTQKPLVMRYVRGKGEQRLDGKYSVGIGGHIEESDSVEADGQTNLANTLGMAAYRELFEETYLSTGGRSLFPPLTIEGLIYSGDMPNTTQVDRVHLGVHMHCHLDSIDEITPFTNAECKEPSGIVEFTWIESSSEDSFDDEANFIMNPEYEPWSQLVLREYANNAMKAR